jgi:hypothetical protein
MTGIKKQAPAGEILVVSGLPRSGTSMMMKMLAAAGYDLVVDERRTADEFNPNGYFEYEPVKSLKEGDGAWLETARGKVVKVVSPLLPYLPPQFPYKVIFMQRNLEEVMASQARMLNGYEKPADPLQDRQIEGAFQEHLRRLEAWMAGQANIQTLFVRYNRILAEPHSILQELSAFLNRPLDPDGVLGVIDPKLYRNRLENQPAKVQSS